MNNTIFDVMNGLRTALLSLNLPVHKDFRPESELGKCLVLTYMPRKKTNVNSINDILVLLYLPKISGRADSAGIQTYCGSISSALLNYNATNGVIFFNDQSEPVTDNMEDFSVTTYKFYTINS